MPGVGRRIIRSPSTPRGQVRIIAGLWRRRVIEVPGRGVVRPTPDRVRETLFNWLGQTLDGLACLDLYAGSGALGFEAASRGARRVVLVERDRECIRVLEGSRGKLGALKVEIVQSDAFAFLDRTRDRFDVVFADPPFGGVSLPRLLGALPACLADGARVYIESGSAVQVDAPWRALRAARAGQVSYQLLEWKQA